MHEFSAHAPTKTTPRLPRPIACSSPRTSSPARPQTFARRSDSFLNGPLPAAVSGLPRQMETVQDAAGKVTEALKET